MKTGHLILRKIFKFVATRCLILRLKCIKFNFGWDSQDLVAEFKGLLLRKGRGRGGKLEGGREIERGGSG